MLKYTILLKTNIFSIHIYIYHKTTIVKTETQVRNKTTNFILKQTMATISNVYFGDSDNDDNSMQFEISNFNDSDDEGQSIQFDIDDLDNNGQFANFKKNSEYSIFNLEQEEETNTESVLDDNNVRSQSNNDDLENCGTDNNNSNNTGNSGNSKPSCNYKEEDETMEIEGDKREIERQLFTNIAVACTQDLVNNLILFNKKAPTFDEFHLKYKSKENETKRLLYMHEVKKTQISFIEYCNAKKSKYEEEFLKKNPTVTSLSYRKRCRESKRRSLKKIYMEQLMSYINSNF